MSIPVPAPDTVNGNGDPNEDEEMDSSDSDDEEEDEAEEIARRLGDHLWAEINKAHADRVASTGTTTTSPNTNSTNAPAPNQNQESTLAAMRTVLSYASSDPQVHTTLSRTPVPNVEGSTSVLDILQQSIDSNLPITPHLARALVPIISALSHSEVLFPPSSYPYTHAPYSFSKRKRDDLDEDTRAPKRIALALPSQLTQAVELITHTLQGPTAGGSTSTADPSTISSIQLPLHQVFLFAMTASSIPSPDTAALQEISGLIQVLGVLSGIQIALPTPPSPSLSSTQHPPTTANAWSPTHQTDIGTAIYPCLLPSCPKIFSRLYSLRTHQRSHALHRPFKCFLCPASFARNHDLKRHVKGHDKLAFKCLGCSKVFSRRDAIKRHQASVKTGVECSDAAMEEIEVEEREGTESNSRGKENRRARLWSGIGAHQLGEDGLEEGEVPVEVVGRARESVTRLQGVLQALVAKALGNDSEEGGGGVKNISESAFLAGAGAGAGDAGQETLASVIARASASKTIMRELPPPAPYYPEITNMNVEQGGSASASPAPSSTPTAPLASYGLNEGQARLLEMAIANATAAAQAQAEAEALWEEGEEDGEEDHDGEGDGDGEEIGIGSV